MKNRILMPDLIDIELSGVQRVENSLRKKLVKLQASKSNLIKINRLMETYESRSLVQDIDSLIYDQRNLVGCLDFSLNKYRGNEEYLKKMKVGSPKIVDISKILVIGIEAILKSDIFFEVRMYDIDEIINSINPFDSFKEKNPEYTVVSVEKANYKSGNFIDAVNTAFSFELGVDTSDYDIDSDTQGMIDQLNEGLDMDNLMDEATEQIGDFFENVVLKGIKDYVGFVIDNIKNHPRHVYEEFMKDMDEIGKEVDQFIEYTAEEIGRIGDGIVSFGEGVVKGVGNGIKATSDFLGDTVEWGTDAVVEGYEWAKDGVQSFKKGTEEFFGSVISFFR